MPSAGHVHPPRRFASSTAIASATTALATAARYAGTGREQRLRDLHPWRMLHAVTCQPGRASDGDPSPAGERSVTREAKPMWTRAIVGVLLVLVGGACF